MRDLVLVGFIATFLLLGFRRPFLFVLAYAYVDIVSPQQLSYYLLNSVPLSMIVAALAIAGWLIADDKRNLSFAPRQGLMLVLLGYIYFSTTYADLPTDALIKWNWAWKALFWAIFLPFTLRTKLRLESYLLVMVLSASSIVIVGGIKTVASGGGYGALNLLVESNAGLYESSTISAVAVAMVPIILWLSRFGTIFPPEWRVRLFAAALIFACLLIPVGTEARTGLVCIGVLGILMLRDAKRRLIYLGLVASAALMAVPFLPQSFTSRMGTISTYQADSSAGSRLAVWAWTWDYVRDHPLGGGFEAYRQNVLRVKVVGTRDLGAVQVTDQLLIEDRGRAYHSSYFEMLGEQGFPGLFLWLAIHLGGLVRMEILRRRYAGAADGAEWISPLATALQSAHVIYLVGSLFIGIAFQPFMLMLVAVQIGLDQLVGRKAKSARHQPLWRAHRTKKQAEIAA